MIKNSGPNVLICYSLLCENRVNFKFHAKERCESTNRGHPAIGGGLWCVGGLLIFEIWSKKSIRVLENFFDACRD
ncbi:MAG: hypothetical protein UW58_C0012G0023 [Candidatus Collierbacteria bacterium GW2011_GWC2_44_30]|nr:MAG: hypothetical protein UW58_C0012G0023 [Candidatus Collierbacteria bacterium GW2011_GWC2_44_30]